MTLDLTGVREVIVTVSFTVPRMLAALMISPFFAQQFITGIARQVVIISLSLLVMPMVHASDFPPGASYIFSAGVLIKEVAIGTMLGFVTGFVFWIAEGAGFLIDNQRGSSMAENFDPMSGESTSPYGLLFSKILGVLFFMGGGFFAFLTIMYESYQIWPVYSFLPSLKAGFPLAFLNLLDGLMTLVVTFAAPLVIAMFLSEFGMGLMNRFSPQLNVFFLSMPVKSGIASILIIFYLVFLAGFFQKEFATPAKMRSFFSHLFNAP